MIPDFHIKQHQNMFRSAEGGLEDFRVLMNAYNCKKELSTTENVHLYILCILCNACSLIKSYCLCDQRWEEVYITGNIYVLINESIKKIIGFKKKNGNRIESLFDVIFNDIVVSNRNEFNSLKMDFIKYADNEELQKAIQEERNIAIHFDDNLNALQLFRQQASRNAQLAFNHFILWFGLMCKLNNLILRNIQNGTEQNK